MVLKLDPVPICRWAVRADYERMSHLFMAGAEPWNSEQVTSAMRQRNIVGRVAEVKLAHGPAIVGAMAYDLRIRSMGLLNLAVYGPWQRRGIGRAMIGDLIGRLESPIGQARKAIVSLVPEDALELQLLLRSCGFKALRVERGVFEDQDGIFFEYLRRKPEPVT